MTPFKHFILFLCFIFVGNTAVSAQSKLSDTLFVQTDTAFNTLGIPYHYYTQIFEYNHEKSNEIMVTFVFTTKKNQAISYRQEVLNSRLEWISKEGLHKKEGIVEAVTANLAAHSSVTWKYRYIINAIPANKVIAFEKSALLIMDDDLDVKKIVWEEKKFILK